MSFLNKIFQSIPVKIPDRSGFDLSHEVLSTAQCGTVTPVTHFEVLPGDTISMGSLMKVTLPPFAVPFMGRIDAELTAAFIPMRLLWKGWERFITQNDGVSPSVSSGAHIPTSVPLVNLTSSHPRGSLADYLGYQYDSSASALPFLAYHKFCDDWVRDDNIMKPFFCKNPIFSSLSIADEQDFYDQLPHFINSFETIDGSVSSDLPNILPLFPSTPNQEWAANNIYDYSIGLGDLRQRCWAKDYFTTATTRPQAGAEASVVFDTSGNTGSFTIASLRAANALQKWAERNNIAGTEYGDQILSHFGVRPPDAVLNRSILLGQVRTPVYVGSVTNNNANANDSGMSATSSPYGNILGSATGFGSGSDKGSLVDNFTAKEHGYIMVFFTLIPHAYYDGGVLRQNKHLSVGDFAWPEFAGIGDQPIEVGEIYTNSNNPTSIFGYNQRYSEYKFMQDRVSGKLASGEDLSVYALKRSFASNPSLGSQFLEIPTNYLEQVFAYWDVDAGSGDELPDGWSCMMDLYFDCKALRVLPEYSLPHL